MISEQWINNTLVVLCDWMDSHNRKVPSGNHKTKEELRLHNFIHNMRRGRKGKSGYTFKQEYQDYVNSRGYPNIFLRIEEQTLLKLAKLCDWMDEHNRKVPSRTSLDLIEERPFGKLISRISCRRFHDIHYQKYRDYMDSRGYPLVLI